MTQEYKVHLDQIAIGHRHRPLNHDAAKRLADSMRQIGLRQPITIRVVDDYVGEDGQKIDGQPILVTGRHRLEAARLLGWETIDCVDADDDEVQAEMWEIAENLHRMDLTKDQRDQHIRRYAELLESQNEVSRQIDAKPKSGPHGGRPEGVASQIARDTGLSKRTVERALRPTDSAPPKEVIDVHEQTRRRMMSAWNAATEEDRQWFRDWIDTPIMG